VFGGAVDNEVCGTTTGSLNNNNKIFKNPEVPTTT
jgi:hypothetical protein